MFSTVQGLEANNPTTTWKLLNLLIYELIKMMESGLVWQLHVPKYQYNHSHSSPGAQVSPTRPGATIQGPPNRSCRREMETSDEEDVWWAETENEGKEPAVVV